MNLKQIATASAVAVVVAAALPSTGIAAGSPTKTVAYTVTVRKGVLVDDATTVRAKVLVTNPQRNVSDWWSRSTVNAVVRKGVNYGFEEPYNSQGYRCVPVMEGAMNVSNANFTCRLRGADVPTTVRITFTAPYNPPTGP
jgi:hypothetical protein